MFVLDLTQESHGRRRPIRTLLLFLAPSNKSKTIGCGIQGNPYPYKEHRANAQDAIKLAREKLLFGEFDMLVCDEINNALKLKLVDLPQVLGLIDSKPEEMHLILTGRDAHLEVIARANTVSEVNEIKHAYREGIEPRKGVDY